MHAIKNRLMFMKIIKKHACVRNKRKYMSFKVICIFKLIFLDNFLKFDLIKRYCSIGVAKNKVAPDELH